MTTITGTQVKFADLSQHDADWVMSNIMDSLEELSIAIPIGGITEVNPDDYFVFFVENGKLSMMPK